MTLLSYDRPKQLTFNTGIRVGEVRLDWRSDSVRASWAQTRPQYILPRSQDRLKHLINSGLCTAVCRYVICDFTGSAANNRAFEVAFTVVSNTVVDTTRRIQKLERDDVDAMVAAGAGRHIDGLRSRL